MLCTTMFPSLAITRDAAVVAGTLAAAAGIGAAAYYVLRRRRPSPVERERLRRENLADNGRIVAGTLLDVGPSEQEPATLRYRYEIAGVSYECVQDVSALVAHLGPLRLDFPVLVRYDRENPADSIVVAEDWTGLRSVQTTSGRLENQRP